MSNRQSAISLTVIGFPLIFIIVAILISFNAVRNFIMLENAVSIEATVVSVTAEEFTDSDGFSDWVYYTNVDYEYQGQEYKNISLGTLSSKYKIGETITIVIDSDSAAPHMLDTQDVFFPLIGALAFGLFGFVMLFKLTKWQLEDKKRWQKIFAFRLPTFREALVGLGLGAIVALFVFLQIYVLNGMIIGAVIFGYFFLIWMDGCMLK